MHIHSPHRKKGPQLLIKYICPHKIMMINFLKVGQYDYMIFKMTLNILHVAIKKSQMNMLTNTLHENNISYALDTE